MGRKTGTVNVRRGGLSEGGQPPFLLELSIIGYDITGSFAMIPKSTLYLALIIASAFTYKVGAKTDWTSILPPAPKAMLKAKVVEADTLDDKQFLGFALFYDPILSSTGNRSCATCHDPDRGFSSGGKPMGLDGIPIFRRAPSLINRGYAPSLFWDGRASSLEDQALQPVLNPVEMGNRGMTRVIERLRPKYGEKFERVYGGLTGRNIAKALASYERTIKSPNRKLEDYLSGLHETANFTDAQARGYELFRGRANCYKCHPVNSPLSLTLTDDRFHNTGLKGDDLGRYRVTRRDEDRGKFRTPSLRGISAASPYMHDASLRTLEDVVEFYDRGGDSSGVPGTKDIQIYPLKLTPRQKSDLVEFLKIL